MESVQNNVVDNAEDHGGSGNEQSGMKSHLFVDTNDLNKLENISIFSLEGPKLLCSYSESARCRDAHYY